MWRGRRLVPVASALLTAWLCLLAAPLAEAHGYRIGALEITHPVIMVPMPGMDCTCAYLRIRNLGPDPEIFLGARISGVAGTRLVAAGSGAASEEVRIAITPGGTLDLRHGWCLFLSGITQRLEADMNIVPGELLFQKAGNVRIEFMIDAAPP